ncbi:MAG: RNA polymerase sigma factor [Oscillospiraceae bacterium]|jgi:RNA polymerase sigma-70 factor (ECF subfamily)|nr:RNA polymerase sigma factor [Oscillospiraceae bacterium]
MEDREITAMFQARDEAAISCAMEQYGALCLTVAYNILGNRGDAEECVNDALLRVWQAIPPARPQVFGAYLLTAVRHAALDRRRETLAERRGAGQIPAALDELSDCIPAPDDPERILDARALRDTLNRFLQTLTPDARTVFVSRYWLCLNAGEIAERMLWSGARVKMSLSRTRKKLKAYLKKEGFSDERI